MNELKKPDKSQFISRLEMDSMADIVNIISKRLFRSDIENKRNMAFIKAVLFATGVTNENIYKGFCEKWNKDNAHLIDYEKRRDNEKE